MGMNVKPRESSYSIYRSRREVLRTLLGGTVLCAAAGPIHFLFPSATANEVASQSHELAPGQLIAVLRRGGYVVYVRHAQTDRTRDDANPPNLKDCSTQRLLSREGEKQADELGVAFREWGIPVGEVYSSPYCRTLETARRAFPKHKITEVPQLGRLARMPRAEVPSANARLKELLSLKTRDGENAFVVGHYENLAAVGGPDIDEAGWAVFQPKGNSYAVVGRLEPAQWRELSRVKQPK
jgi:phosphohistidine phosphatase SixA